MIAIATVVAADDGRTVDARDLSLDDQSSSPSQAPIVRSTTSSTQDSGAERGVTSDSNEAVASETSAPGCIEDYLDSDPQVDDITTSRLPEGRTAEDLPIRTSPEQRSALLFQQGSEVIGVIQLYWLQGIGLEIVEVVDALCNPIAWESHQTPTVHEVGMTVEFETNGQLFELSIEADRGLIRRATLIAA